MAKGNGSKRLRTHDFRVDEADRPGWVTGSQRMLGIGEEVYCIGGAGTVSAVKGKTGDGSQLLEIRLEDVEAKPFFASAANVLIAPT